MTQRGPFSIEGKTAIVTGGAAGIGFGIAKRFVEGGANVLLVDIDSKALEASTQRLKEGPGRAASFVVDIAQEAAPQAIVGQCVERFGAIDILVNNAGIFPQVPLLQLTPEVFDRVIDINLRALVFLSRAVGLKLIEQKRGGKIINIGSIDSLHPSMAGLSAYDASKGGVLMFTRSLALEMAPHGITANAILPGGITTEGTSRPLAGSGMSEAQMREVMANFVKTKIPLGRMGVPDDIAKVAVFLASSASDYMTGAHVVVDGGTLTS